MYTKTVVGALGLSKYFSKIYNRDDCRSIEGAKPFKDLRVVGIPLKNVILVDVKLFFAIHVPNLLKTGL